MREHISIHPEALALFEQDDRIESVFLHGSYASGRERADSDMDFAILPASGIHLSDYERAILAGKLSIMLHKTADLSELSSRNLVYAKEVLSKGIPVYVRDRQYLQYMTMTLLSMYAIFNEDRAEVLHAWTS